MKNCRKFYPLFVLAMLAAGCENPQDTHFPYVNVPLDNHNVELTQQDVVDIGIGIASDSYRIEIDDPSIVTAEVVDGAIRLTALEVGNTMLLLADDGYNRARMSVVVKRLQDFELEPIPGGLTMLRLDNDGTPKKLKIISSNGEPFLIDNSNQDEIDAYIGSEGDEFFLIMEGKSNVSQATVTVTDAKGKSGSVSLRVTDPLQAITLDQEGPLTGEYVYGGTSPQITIDILTGNGGYTITSSNPGVATAEVSGGTITVSVVGDGGTVLTLMDQEDESRTIELFVPLNSNDPSPRIYWDGYRADLNTPGVSVSETFATKKEMYWNQVVSEGVTNKYYVTFNGGWSDGLECVGAANRNPGLTTTINGIETAYTGSSTIPLTSFKLVKQINATPTPVANPRVYWMTFEAAGKRGFLVFGWQYPAP